MTIEFKPVGDRCNLHCQYCYEKHTRSVDQAYDFERAKKTLSKGRFTVFGGEPLLTPIERLEEIFKFGFEKHGSNGIQTNATLITEEHIRLFKQYKVHVGVSIDGPGNLNQSRCDAKTTSLVEQKIDLLIENGIVPSVIVTFTTHNTKGNLPAMAEWFKELYRRGVRSVRLHTLEVDDCSHIAPSQDDLIYAFKFIKENVKVPLSFDVFDELGRALKGDATNLTCIWNGCDPYNTSAVDGVQANGDSANCGRTYKTNVIWIKSERIDDIRTRVLENTPQEDGGCKDCKYFSLCKGNCPGTAIDGDWRNRSADCKFWYAIMDFLAPADFKQTKSESHGDSPHGDWHGDHTDTVLVVPVISK